MRTIALLFLCLGLVGCAGTDQLVHLNGEGESYYRVTDFSVANAAAPGYTLTILEKCLPGITTNCEQISVHHTATSGVITSLAGPVIYGAAIVGAAHLLGEGIAESGDNITQQSGGPNSFNAASCPGGTCSAGGSKSFPGKHGGKHGGKHFPGNHGGKHGGKHFPGNHGGKHGGKHFPGNHGGKHGGHNGNGYGNGDHYSGKHGGHNGYGNGNHFSDDVGFGQNANYGGYSNYDFNGDSLW